MDMDATGAPFYHRRALEVALRRIGASPVVVLEGPRTVGKSTLLGQIAERLSAHIFDLDDVTVMDQVEADPYRCVASPRPVLVDEYLRVPSLLEYIKAQLNRDGSPGQFVVTGSAGRRANPEGLKALVGRLEEIEVFPLSQIEMEGRSGNFVATAFGDIDEMMSWGRSHTSRSEYVERVLAGGFPEALASRTANDRTRVFDSYIAQSLDYGQSAVSSIRQPADMQRLLFRYGAQTGQLLNIANAAQDIDINPRTAEKYTRLLELLFFIFRLPAWKKTDSGPVSRPKLHLVDSGVGSRILRLTAERTPGYDPLFETSFGHLLESFVVSEVRKAVSWLDEPFKIGYWRNRARVEVDLVIESLNDGTVIGLEVKSSSRVSKSDIKGLRSLQQELGSRFQAGLLLYTGDMPYRLADDIYAVPIDKLWHGQSETPGERRTMAPNILTADGDPLSAAVRAATDEMVERLELGNASWWELAIVPSSNVSFGDFYSSEGVAGELRNVGHHALRGTQGFGLGGFGETEPINQCVALLDKGRRGVLIHPLGAMVAVASGTSDFLGWAATKLEAHAKLNDIVIREWALEFALFAHRVLVPHGPGLSWTYWSRGRFLRKGRPQLYAEPFRFQAVVDNPLHRGIVLMGNAEVEAFSLVSSFYEWFGIAASTLTEANEGRVSAEDIIGS